MVINGKHKKDENSHGKKKVCFHYRWIELTSMEACTKRNCRMRAFEIQFWQQLSYISKCLKFWNVSQWEMGPSREAFPYRSIGKHGTELMIWIKSCFNTWVKKWFLMSLTGLFSSKEWKSHSGHNLQLDITSPELLNTIWLQTGLI